MTLPAPSDLIGRSHVSDWLEIDAEHLAAFSRGSYLEPDRVDLTISQNNAFGPTLVDGFLLLSLLVYFDFSEPFVSIEGGYGLNYGTDRVRFTTPVFVGDRVRLKRTVLEAEVKTPTRTLVTLDTELELEKSGDTAMYARWLYLLIDRKAEEASDAQ
ncbi:MaoC/PaaZ C-terminal domain-containing protein [Aeromicrobium piscarium]|uniref:MaoC-like domain-containing protein n=1 Tax=Aeromicrobium piscarium TaxID=2590901 RepID=A0A554RK72_9ACTN|nr:MaoC/PaaZ C-terminal domain-containing protein [Aeromicrobium piscarium]TSD54513.1 hypothetical protein FNM00_17350 [Aeromicrobium piscarium]